MSRELMMARLFDRFHSLTGVLSAAFVISLTGCGGRAPQEDLALLGLFEAGGIQSAPVSVGNSRRVALSTEEGVELSAQTRIGRGATLELALAAPDADGRVRACVEFVDLSSGKTLSELELEAGSDWERHRIPAPAVHSGLIRLTSAGAAPVAWAELYLLGPTGGEGAATDDHPRPDIVLVLLDTVRADHLSTYGYERATSPNLDRFGESAWVFERSYSASTWTLPSTASLLTGLLPAQHGLRSYHDALSDRVVTVAEALRQAGYRTVAFTDGGFLDPQWGFAQGSDRYDVTPGAAWEAKDVAKLAAAAADWIEGNEFHPYFLLFHTYEAHNPYTNTEGFADRFFTGPPSQSSDLDQAKMKVYAERGEAAGANDPINVTTVALYDGEIARLDFYLEKVIDSLREKGNFADTAVLITSDHGEELLDHGNLEHGLGKVFDCNVRVPLILKTPGRNTGARIAAPTSGLDVFPTLLELAGVPVPRGLEGSSLLSLIESGTEMRERSLLIEGLSSFPELDEDRYRIDQGSFTLIHDLVRGETRWYDRLRDSAMRDPREDLSDPRALRAAAHLQATLAWLYPAELAVRLPAGLESVTVEESSCLEPRGARLAFEWRPARSRGKEIRIALEAESESYLLFDLRRAACELTAMALRTDGRTPEEIRIGTRVDGSGPLVWSSKSESPPPFLVAFPTFHFYNPAEAEISPEAARELRALGYLD